MRIRILSWLLIFPLLFLIHGAAEARGGFNTVKLRAARTTLLADGKQATEIIAEVRDSSGRAVGNDASVQFQTTLGTLSAPQVQTFGGVARVRLTSAVVTGVAHITAFTPGGAGDSIDIQFTDDPEALFEGNLYVQITGASYLAYSATDRVIEAEGKRAGARLSYRNLEIASDRMQVRCDDMIVRAHDNVTLKRGKDTVHATRLYYSLQSNQGYAIAELNGRLQTVLINGEHLVMSPSPTPIPTSYIMFPKLQVKLVIVARSITYFPNDRLQFRRPKFYQDQAQIMSLPYYELAINSTELFSDQFVSVGTNGFGLELPFYYNLTPNSSGIVYLRHQQQIGRSYYSNTPGWALDAIQSYSALGSQKYEGSFGFTQLTRSDWGFRWTHNQEFNTATQGSFYLDFPQHNSVIGSTNLTLQSRAFRYGLNLGAEQTFLSPNATSLRSDFYVETQPKPVGKTRAVMYTLGTTLSSGSVHSTDPLIGSISQTTQSLNLRAFTRPLNINQRTTLTNSLTLGQVWGDKGDTGTTTLLTMALDHTLPGGGLVNLTYDYVAEPGNLMLVSGHHRMSLTYNITNTKRFAASIFGSAFLDSPDASLLGDFIYRLDNRWRLLASLTWQKFGDDSYRDLQLTIGRRIGARELQLTYSTFLHRISLDFTATRF